MKHAKIVKLVSAVLGVAGLFWAAELLAVAKAPRFEIVGPPETARLEKTLGSRLGVYAWGIWPRTEKFQKAVAGPNVPEKYVQRMETWLSRILRKDFLPDKLDPNRWHGFGKLDGWSDFVIGQYINTAQDATVQFRGDGLLLGITVLSKEFFSNGVAGLTDDQVIKAITSLVNYPEDKVKDITIEKHFEEMGDPNNKVLVCYGKLRAPEPTIVLYRFKRKVRTWWSFMPFWITKNKIFICTSMVNWESFPASLDPYVFKF